MEQLRNPAVLAGAAAAGAGGLYLACCRSAGGAASGGGGNKEPQKKRAVGSTRVYSVTSLEEPPGGPTDCGFQLDIPCDWQVDEEDQHGARVFKFRKAPEQDPRPADDDEEGPEEQPVLLILEKLTEDVGVVSYADTAKEGTIQQLERLGEVKEVDVTDGTEVQGCGRFVQWQLLLRSDPQEDTENYPDEHGEPQPAEPINMWSGVCIHGGYAWAFQICGGHGFEAALNQARKLAASLQFTTSGR